MSKLGNHILIFILILITTRVFGTAQFPDILVDGEDTVAIYSNPLEQYLEKKTERVFCGKKLDWTSTACYRGYLAFWKIRDEKLYLTKVWQGCGEIDAKEFKIKKEFGQKIVFADWYTGMISSPRGELLQYVHDGYGSIFEQEKYIYITNGIIDSVKTKKYLEYDDNFLNPSEDLLYDTLRKIIIRNLDSNQVNNFVDSNSCSINIRFNSLGLIDSIYNGYNFDGISFMEEYILSVADTSFNNLPRLMTVNHERYFPPRISIFLSAYCLQNPCDFEYGCKGYGCDKEIVKKKIAKYKKGKFSNLILIISIGIALILFGLFIRKRLKMK